MRTESHLAPALERVDAWLRSDFRAINTRLENAYFEAGSDDLRDRDDLVALKRALLAGGAACFDELAGCSDQLLAAAPSARYEVLGMVGCYLGACGRHRVDLGNEDVLAGSWHLASRLGASLGVAPRYVFAHLAFHSGACDGDYRTFTELPDERRFVELNGLAVLACQRAADALRPAAALGPSHPMLAYLLDGARAALDDVLAFNRQIAETVDVDRFFVNVRPYFRPFAVGDRTYRGANAGDFAAVNEIDVLLGLCSPDDAFYRALLDEKRPFVPPADQPLLDALSEHRSLLDQLLEAMPPSGMSEPLRGNANRFLEVCRAHGAAYAFHHTNLVKRYVEQPARAMPAEETGDITASGPPLDEVVAMLDRLRRLRIARDGAGVRTAQARLDELRARASAGRVSSSA